MGDWDLPRRGVAFWPVGNGDCVTIAVDAETVIQLDVNHCKVAEDDDDDRVPVVDRLAEVLPIASDSDRPRLAVLAITHHDTDHCSGFARICDEFQVDEMWLTLRSFVEDKNQDALHDEGQSVYDEAQRRRDAEIKARESGKERADVGDRLRIIGRHELLGDPDWEGFPTDLVTRAGQYIPTINGEDRSDVIEVFVHTPFHEDTGDGTRNSSSLGLQVTLRDADCEKRFLLLGDLEYEQIEAFFDKSVARGNADRLRWDFLLAPHHCSRNAIRRLDDDKWIDADALARLGEYAATGAKVVVSSRAFDSKTSNDTDPPHEDARDAYERIVDKDNVHWTADVAEGTDSDPLTFVIDAGACGEQRLSKIATKEALSTLSAATGVQIRAGDATSGTGRREFA